MPKILLFYPSFTLSDRTAVAHLMYRASQKKPPQHENSGTYVTEKYFYITFPRLFSIISSQVCLILLHLLNIWRSDAASKSVFDFL